MHTESRLTLPLEEKRFSRPEWPLAALAVAQLAWGQSGSRWGVGVALEVSYRHRTEANRAGAGRSRYVTPYARRWRREVFANHSDWVAPFPPWFFVGGRDGSVYISGSVQCCRRLAISPPSPGMRTECADQPSQANLASTNVERVEVLRAAGHSLRPAMLMVASSTSDSGTRARRAP